MYKWSWMDNDAALEIAEWEYEGDISVYNLADDLDALDEFLNPFNWKYAYAIYDYENYLKGFMMLKPTASNGFTIERIGLHPSIINQGYGMGFIKYCIDIVQEKYQTREINVHIPIFNKRAINVFSKNGFVQKGQVKEGNEEFIILVLSLE
ncbi:GNAT family N-acetyltransferase [Evansella sp. AB-P1]|uniref:GNAT family N-acetyltransferase n=1 Tax=Evansella sp. AB-P1 TaxID=3037653 RepID=UPI00241F401F|nr:GNAT family N-acetyltransferase [Evansella sp. AB-P1]MDG5786337.1 GNAT family N-acetyltransferase [Evansella sp. AB-P1]